MVFESLSYQVYLKEKAISYLSPIIDLFNGEIISYDLSEKANFNKTLSMLKKSFEKIPDETN